MGRARASHSKLALANTDRQAAAFRGLGSGIGGTEFFGMCQGGVNQVFKKTAAVAEAFGRFVLGRFDSLCGSSIARNVGGRTGGGL